MNNTKLAEIALANGQRTFEGKPCKKCGNTLRRSENLNCVMCHRASSKRYAIKNREKCLAKYADWKIKNYSYMRSQAIANGKFSSQVLEIVLSHGLTLEQVYEYWGCNLQTLSTLYKNNPARIRIICKGINAML